MPDARRGETPPIPILELLRKYDRRKINKSPLFEYDLCGTAEISHV